MPVLLESIKIGDWLKGEVEIPQHHSRDIITFTNAGGAAANFTTGTVLGKITATGKFVPYAPAAADGSQTAVAILGPTLTAVPATSDISTWAITRIAEVADINLAYTAGTTVSQVAAAVSSLATQGIIVRRTA